MERGRRCHFYVGVKGKIDVVPSQGLLYFKDSLRLRETLGFTTNVLSNVDSCHSFPSKWYDVSFVMMHQVQFSVWHRLHGNMYSDSYRRKKKPQW